MTDIATRLVRATLAAALAAGAACTGGADAKTDAPQHSQGAITLAPDQESRVRTVVAEQSTYTPVIRTTGTVEFDQDQSTQVLAPISGPVSRILVEPGTWVDRGAVLALVSSPDFATAVAAYRKAAATARNARRIADLDQQLYRNDAIARRDVEQAEVDATSAEADRDAALEQLRAIGVDARTIADLQAGKAVAAPQGEIRAPIAGTVVEKLITPGQLLQAGSTPCFTIADLSKMWVMANVFESDLAAVQSGDAADVTTNAASLRFPGRVDYVAALVDPTTRATSVRIVVPNLERLLKKDMYVNAAIHSRRSATGILLPVGAVLRDDENLPFVYVQLPDGSFSRRRIDLGSRIGDQYVITSGVKPGEKIVSEGGLFLQFAQSQ